MVYGEARGEAEIGQIAVAWTAVNRATNTTICNVVLAPMQYSVFNDNPEMIAAARNLHIKPPIKNAVDRESWDKAKKVAEAVLKRKSPDPTDGAVNYLAPAAMKSFGYAYPTWTKTFLPTTVIDNHHFYKPRKPKKVPITW